MNYQKYSYPLAKKKKSSLPHFLAGAAVFVYILFSIFLPGCANIQSPMGGAKDSFPPKLVKATPGENTINFKGNTVRFEFDEYIKLDQLNENLIINPPAEKFPIINSKLRNLTIKLLDTLKPNTTYTINFGNAVRDVNEGNPLKNFSYAFSTGPYIDSLELTGKLVDAETGLPDSTLMVILHDTEADSAVAKKKPRFATRLNGRGVFHFDHLPSGKYYIFGLKDEGLKMYTSNQLAFAFHDSVVQTGVMDSIILRSFVGEKEPEKKPKASGLGKNEKKPDEKRLTFTSSVANSTQDLLGPLLITFPHKIAGFDSSKIRLTDTLFAPVAGYHLTLDSTGTILSLANSWKDNQDYRLILEKAFAHDSAGLATGKTDTIKFKTKSESDYGSLKLKISGVDLSKNPLIQFVDNNAVVFTAPLTGAEYTNKLFKPAQYKIRILYDINKNGIWDTGNYWEKKQPELVIPVEQNINVKANWDNEVEIRL
jgi:hypothetical protein